MKNVKLLFSAMAVIAIVGGSLAFKAFVPFQKLYRCNLATDKCVLIDPNHNYMLSGSGTLFQKSILATTVDPPTGICEDPDFGCPNDIRASVEP